MPDFQLFKYLLEQVNDEERYEPQSYSGRGMYGAQCIGVSTDGKAGPWLGHMITLKLIELMDDVKDGLNKDYPLEELQEFLNYGLGKILSRTCEDSLGRGAIIYWPNVPWEDEEEEDDGEAHPPGES